MSESGFYDVIIIGGGTRWAHSRHLLHACGHENGID